MMMREPALVELAEQRAFARLQSHKNSFHTWRCVALACSLLATLMLLARWHEVSTDLSMLLGIERLLSAPQQPAAANGSSGALSWPPVPLEQLLPPLNETGGFGMESLESNGTMLMSHMQMSLSRELTGSQLLRQEVETFAAEFRNAKSTLGLSTLLVSVYMISWILMMLATKETHSSNDISLRNILLLSVFGAIDLAASLGFVMVRMLMYAVKNNSFAAQILGSSGLSDTPTRLSADQLTAFTALRLIAMRSCSAHVDVYVSVLVALLTLLRLYAILRAIAYFRRRRVLLDRRHELAAEEHQRQQVVSSQHQHHFQRKPHIWSTANLFEPASATDQQQSHLISGAPHEPQQVSNNYQPAPPQRQNPSFRLAPLSERLNYQVGVPLGSFGQPGTARRSSSQRQQSPPQAQQQQAATLMRGQRAPPTSLVLLSSRQTASSSRQRRRAEEKRAAGGGPSVVLVNGRAHHLVTDGSLSEPAGPQLQQQVLPSERAQQPDQQQQEQEHQLNFRSLDELGPPPPVGTGESDEQVFQLAHESSEQNLLNTTGEPRSHFGTIRSNGTTYTLLSADQLEQISRKLLGNSRAAVTAVKSPQPVAPLTNTVPPPPTGKGPSTGAKWRLISARQYRQFRSKSQTGGSAGIDSSTSCGPDDSDNSLTTMSASRTQVNRKKLNSLRHSEELQVADSLKQHMFEVPGVDSKSSAGNLLKYYYYT